LAVRIALQILRCRKQKSRPERRPPEIGSAKKATEDLSRKLIFLARLAFVKPGNTISGDGRRLPKGDRLGGLLI
jgi:hypothetical protein